VHSVIGDHVIGEDTKPGQFGDNAAYDNADRAIRNRNIFLPISHDDGSNPDIEIKAPYPGVFIYRFSEGFNYPNANHYLDHLTNHIFANTRRTNPNSYGRPGDRPWNDPGPRRGQAAVDHSDRPTLKAIILDFSSVNNVDITAVQQLIDVRNQLNRYTSPEVVDWHMACINNRWTKRALASAGFGYPSAEGELPRQWKPIFSVAEIGGSDSAAHDAELKDHEKDLLQQQKTRETNADAIHADSSSSSSNDVKHQVQVKKSVRTAVVHGLNRPLFHIDLTSALQSAIANLESREAFEAKGGAGIGREP
jgi:sodium-independent sulfate anion transporter 11